MDTVTGISLVCFIGMIALIIIYGLYEALK